MKRYILGEDADGNSHVESVVELDDAVGKLHVWCGGIAPLEEGVGAIAIDPENADLHPGPHGLNVMINRIPPDRDRERHGYTRRPMHRTRTLDFDFILDGELHLQLDRETVILRTGDVAILRGANHLWGNPTDRVATMMNFLYEPR